MRSRYLWFALIPLSTAAPSARVGLAAKAVPKRPAGTRAPAPTVAKPTRPSDYERLLGRYQRSIDATVVDRRQRLVQRHNDNRQQAAAVLSDLRAKGSEALLQELRTRASASPGGKLHFEGDVLENWVLRAGSPESAEAFTALVNEGLAEPGPVLSVLSSSDGPLASEWAPFLEEAVRRRDPARWVPAAIILYRAGISRAVCRPLLEQVATEGCATALETLLFDIDSETGLPSPSQTPGNRALLQRLAAPGSPPEVIAACADYAAQVGDRALAESLCTELLWRPYRGHGDSEGAEPDPADGPLYRARVNALSVLFYHVRTDSAFEQVYHRANIAWTACDHPEKLPPEFRHFARYAAAQLEIQYAQALVRGVEDHAQ